MASLVSTSETEAQSLLQDLNAGAKPDSLQSAASTVEFFQKRLSHVRKVLLQNASYGNIKRPSLTWFEYISKDLEKQSKEEVTTLYSIMGLALSVVALIFKHTETTQNVYDEEAIAFDGVVRCLQVTNDAVLTSAALDVTILVDAKSGIERFKTLMVANTVAHQCIEVLEEVVAGAGQSRKPPLSRMAPSSCAIFSLLGKARQWQEESGSILKRNERAYELLGRLEVDICKLAAMAAEWMRGTESGVVGEADASLLHAPQAILSITLCSAVVHDCFLTAFQLVCETARKRFPGREVQRQLSLVLQRACNFLKIDAAALVAHDSYLLAVKRAECATTIVGMVFEIEDEPGSSRTGSHEDECGGECVDEESASEDSTRGRAVDISLRCLIGLQTSLKKVCSAARHDEDVTATQRAEIARACSDCRRACITSAITILTTKATLSGPKSGDMAQSGVEWVMQSIADPSGAFWSMCLLPQQLSTPLLLPVAYNALSTAGEGQQRDDGMDILMYELHRALGKTPFYSLEAAKDVLLAVSQLCEKGCIELYREEEEDQEGEEEAGENGSVAQSVLVAYKSSRQYCKANTEWKIHAALALRSLVHLLRTCQSHPSSSSSFCEGTLSVLAMDMVLLYSAVLPSEMLHCVAPDSFTLPSKHEVSAKLGIRNVEDQASALHTLTQTSIQCIDCMLHLSAGQRGYYPPMESVCVLFEVLKKVAGRALVYEDDKWQASMEPALVGKLALLLHSSSPYSTQSGEGSVSRILCDAVDTMCVQAGLRAPVPSSNSSSTQASSSSDICYVHAREEILSLSEALIPGGSGGNPLLRELNSSLPLSLEELTGDRTLIALKIKAIFAQIHREGKLN